MHARFQPLTAWLIVWFAAHSALAKEIQLLHGHLSFNTPVDISQTKRAHGDTDRYSVLADLVSPDGGFSVNVTYGKHALKAPDLTDFLRQKIDSYTTLNAKLPHFHWIEHHIVTRDGRKWAEICFSHDNESGARVYTRCVSCFVQGHLLEIWALTRRAEDPSQKSHVDHLIDSVRLAPRA